jgi:hypothetical protein
MDLSKALEKPRVMRALSGLNPHEFENLARTFAEVWEEHTQENWQGQPRARAKGAGPKAELESAEQKLFFILFYLHNYPTQEVMGYLFGFEQPQANKWIMRLLPLLQRALERQLALPERRTEELEKLLAECTAEARLFLDGTDRPVRRPKDPDKQKDRYSGRKKRHTVKNLILTRERTATFLSPTRPGRESDKRLAEALQSVAFPKGSVLITDLGFEGLSIQNATLIQAAKKPKGGQLSSALKLFNRIVAGARVRVEHVISSIKRCNILRDTFRHMKEGYDDLVMEVACGLHNFREAHRSGSPPVLSPLQRN